MTHVLLCIVNHYDTYYVIYVVTLRSRKRRRRIVK